VDHDIIIVGAGPAGLSTGLHLAQLAPGLARRTIILEREHHPRPKLCAGGLMPGGIAWLRNLGLDPGDVPSVLVHEAHFLFEGNGFVVRRQPYVFCIVRRDEFDAWLAGAARERGLRLQENTRVRRVRCLDHVVEVETDRGTYRARAVVGADGAAGVVRRAMARDRVPQVARLLETLVPRDSGAPSPVLQSSLSPSDSGEGWATLDFSWMGDGVQGYVWDFPTRVQGRPMRTVGIFDSRVHPRAPRASLKAALGEALARGGMDLDRGRLGGHPLRCFHPRGVFSEPRVLLVGDAAGVDPLLGEGISFALGYGDVAARALRDAFARDDLSFAGYRERVLTHRVGRFLRRRAAVSRLLYGTRSRRLLHFLGWSLGPLIGWVAEHYLVDWGGSSRV